MTAYVDCPTCGRKTEFSPQNRWRPFCSQRCKLIDLGAWASGQYTSPGSEPDPDSTPAADADKE
jgi:uncharacterized protein